MSGNKHIVITGAARGIGRATARHLALLGHKLFLIDIDEAELSHTATSHIPEVLASKANTTTAASSVSYKSCDLRDPVAIRNTIKSAAEFLNGRIDVLVNNAGIARAQFTGNRTMEDPSVFDEWTAYLETNLTAPFLVSQACIPYMKLEDEKREHPKEAVIRPEAAKPASGLLEEEERSIFSKGSTQGPCIINISSFRAHQSEPNCEAYGASKAGLLGLTQSMAISGAQWGIRCNAILPGYIYVRHECQEADESQGELHWAKDVTESRHRTHPTGRIGYGEDIAEAVEWLMGAGFMTGQELVIDGGVSKIKQSTA
ncbi:hypothetical protein VP1G_04022 [Cytospora mali]|uniref:3-oxoacyl-[acyl-carrier-protein] reductase FabG n=1 Tax=Cytospora mali TaxID=578113 RepID=A0A194UYH2_CYTMA|nr:hypothetical protein VP1G_04022 [Valsa mali var. pyri (nom. inval.)]